MIFKTPTHFFLKQCKKWLQDSSVKWFQEESQRVTGPDMTSSETERWPDEMMREMANTGSEGQTGKAGYALGGSAPSQGLEKE